MAKVEFAFEDAFEDDEPAAVIVSEPPRTAIEVDVAKQQVRDDLRNLEDEILRDSMAIISDAAKFRELDPAATEPPPEWIAELGLEEAWKRFRMANAAWANAKQAPVGLSIAKSVMVGIAKARAAEKQAPNELNMVVQFVHQPQANYSVKKLESK